MEHLCKTSLMFQWLIYSYKLVKMLSVCVDVNKGGTNRNCCTQRLDNLACTDLIMNPDYTTKNRSPWPPLLGSYSS